MNLIYVEAILLALAIGGTLWLALQGFMLSLCLAMKRVDKISMGYWPWFIGILWGLVFLIHALRVP